MTADDDAGPATGRAPGPGRLASRPGGLSGPGRPAGVHLLPGRGRQAPLLLVPPASRAAPQPRPLLVFFHGAGGRGEQALPLVEEVAASLGVLVLLPTSAGRTWDLLLGGVGPDVRALDAALRDVFAGHHVGRVGFAGFSDGGSYALSVGLANGDLADAVLAFSPGFAAPPAQVGAPRVFISHGTADAVLPVDRCGRRVARTLRDARYDVRYEEFEGGHVVPPHLAAAALGWWLADGADGAGPDT